MYFVFGNYTVYTKSFLFRYPRLIAIKAGDQSAIPGFEPPNPTVHVTPSRNELIQQGRRTVDKVPKLSIIRLGP